MPIFVIFIVISLSFYLFYKFKYFRTKHTLNRRIISAKSSIALGIFVSIFGINQFTIHGTTIALVIGIVFLLFGIGSIFAGYRAFKYFYPLMLEETKKA